MTANRKANLSEFINSDFNLFNNIRFVCYPTVVHRIVFRQIYQRQKRIQIE